MLSSGGPRSCGLFPLNLWTSQRYFLSTDQALVRRFFFNKVIDSCCRLVDKALAIVFGAP